MGLLTAAVSSRATVPSVNRQASCGPIKRRLIKCNCSLEIGTKFSATNLARLLKPAYTVCALRLTRWKDTRRLPSEKKTSYTSVILRYSHYMDKFCAVTTNCITTTVLRTKILIFLIIHLCFIFVSFKFPEDCLKKNETCPSIKELYAKEYTF